MGCALWVVALAPRWLAHVTMHHGVAVVDDSASDGASSPGVALGFQAGAQVRVTPTLSIGAALDLTRSGHETPASVAAEASYTHYFPVVVGRIELGRFALVGWGGYERGHRRVDEDGGLFGGTTYSDDSIQGLVLGGSGVVRIRAPSTISVHVEIGPFVQTAAFVSDADGSVRTLVVGLLFQAAFNAPPVTGDSF